MGDQPLNIEVAGDPEACRATATWLARLSEGVGDLGAVFGRAGSQSESFWRGSASDAFRGVTAHAKDNAGEVERTAAAAAQALSRFADELATVKSRMEQARHVATRAGLRVTTTEIHPPEAGPDPAYELKAATFNEVTGTVNEARGTERAAHDTLRAAVQRHDETLDSLRTYGAQALSQSVSLIGGLAGASEKLLRSSERSMQLAVLATALQASPTLPAGARDYLTGAQAELLEKYYKNQLDRAGIEKIIGKIPPPVRQLLTVDLSYLVKWMARIDQGINPALDKEIPVLKRLPVVGTALTGASATIEMGKGADKLKTVESAVGSTAAAMGVAAGVEGAVAAAAAAGLAVPGPGWVVAGTLVLGTAAACGVGYVVDHYGDQINDAIGSGASSVARGASPGLSSAAPTISPDTQGRKP